MLPKLRWGREGLIGLFWVPGSSLDSRPTFLLLPPRTLVYIYAFNELPSPPATLKVQKEKAREKYRPLK